MTCDHWKATEPDDGFEPIAPDEPEFCLIHGYDYMMDSPGNPIPWCAQCEKDREAARPTPAEGV